MRADCLIRNALVCDGTGAEPRIMDVAIGSDKIAAAGSLEGLETGETIDASGMVLSPGFIDVHSHDDFSVLMTPDMEYKVRQGVTTSIIGNCGFSVAPNRDALEQTIFYHEKSLLPVWDTFSSYRECFSKAPSSINIGILAGLGALRYAAAKDSRGPLDREGITRLREMVEEALGEGILGLSLGLAYFPGKFSDSEELMEAVGTMRGRGALFAVHMRDEGHALIPAVEEVIGISRKTGVPAQISHFKALGRDNFHLFNPAMEVIERAREEGVSVTADLYPFDSGSTALKEVIDWGIFSPGGQHAMFSAEPSDIVIVSSETNPQWIGKTITDLSGEYGPTPLETARKIVAVEENVLIAIKNAMSEENIEAALKKPYSMIGSDGIPTKTGFSNPRLYGTFPRVLGRYTRDRKTLSLREAVYKMTGFPASRFALKDRGVIREGAAADLVIFSYGEIADRADYSNPKQYPAGIRDVFVNGAAVLREGVLTGRRPGRPLTGR